MRAGPVLATCCGGIPERERRKKEKEREKESVYNGRAGLTASRDAEVHQGEGPAAHGRAAEVAEGPLRISKGKRESENER